MKRSYFWCFFYAELRKIYASRMPYLYHAGIFAAVYLWVFSLYHVEKISKSPYAPAPKNFFAVLPLLFSGTWVSLFYPVSIIAFCAYWLSIESQYGMIRVACTQPVSRFEYLLGKYAAISVHIVLIALGYLASLCTWLILYSGVRGFTAADAGILGRWAIDAVVFTLALAWIGMAAASLRRTMATALITACLVCIGLGFFTTIPHDVIHPKYIFMRYFVFPIGDLPNPYNYDRRNNPFIQIYTHAEFYRVMLITPLLFIIPSIFAFRRRDITE